MNSRQEEIHVGGVGSRWKTENAFQPVGVPNCSGHKVSVPDPVVGAFGGQLEAFFGEPQLYRHVVGKTLGPLAERGLHSTHHAKQQAHQQPGKQHGQGPLAAFRIAEWRKPQVPVALPEFHLSRIKNFTICRRAGIVKQAQVLFATLRVEGIFIENPQPQCTAVCVVEGLHEIAHAVGCIDDADESLSAVLNRRGWCAGAIDGKHHHQPGLTNGLCALLNQLDAATQGNIIVIAGKVNRFGAPGLGVDVVANGSLILCGFRRQIGNGKGDALITMQRRNRERLILCQSGLLGDKGRQFVH